MLSAKQRLGSSLNDFPREALARRSVGDLADAAPRFDQRALSVKVNGIRQTAEREIVLSLRLSLRKTQPIALHEHTPNSSAAFDSGGIGGLRSTTPDDSDNGRAATRCTDSDFMTAAQTACPASWTVGTSLTAKMASAQNSSSSPNEMPTRAHEALRGPPREAPPKWMLMNRQKGN